MWRSLFLFLFVAVSVAHAAETPGNDRNSEPDACEATIRALYKKRKNCIFTFIKHLKQNDTADSVRNCTDLDSMESNFSVGLQNNSKCWNQEMTTSMKTRVTILRRLLNSTKENDQLRDFLNNGFKCIANKTDLQNNTQKCIDKYMKGEVIYKNNLSRVTPFLYYGKTSCSKSTSIMDCAMKIINKQCTEPKERDFVPFLRQIIINGQCDKTTTTNSPRVKSGSSAGIIIGVLLGIVALIILGLVAFRKFKKRPLEQTVQYRVSYHNQEKEKSNE